MEAKGLASLILGGRFVAPNASGGNAANSAISIDETYMYGIAVGASNIFNRLVQACVKVFNTIWRTLTGGMRNNTQKLPAVDLDDTD